MRLIRHTLNPALIYKCLNQLNILLIEWFHRIFFFIFIFTFEFLFLFLLERGWG